MPYILPQFQFEKQVKKLELKTIKTIFKKQL
jgi:hypothetical protein